MLRCCQCFVQLHHTKWKEEHTRAITGPVPCTLVSVAIVVITKITECECHWGTQKLHFSFNCITFFCYSFWPGPSLFLLWIYNRERRKQTPALNESRSGSPFLSSSTLSRLLKTHFRKPLVDLPNPSAGPLIKSYILVLESHLNTLWVYQK